MFAESSLLPDYRDKTQENVFFKTTKTWHFIGFLELCQFELSGPPYNFKTQTAPGLSELTAGPARLKHQV